MLLDDDKNIIELIDERMCDYCAWIEKLLRPPRLEALSTICQNVVEEPRNTVKYDRAILVHGTADSVSSREEINVILERIERAATEAYKELAKGCESVDAVELAIRHLENEEPSTDRGEKFGVPEENYWSVIKDAVIMDSDSNAGSVGAVTGILHPITLAKRVMRKTDHVLIAESGVDKLLSTDHEEEIGGMQTGNKISKVAQKCIRICGSIARDRKGKLACGASTIDNRQDSIARSSMSAAGTVLGCGVFADEESCCSVSGEDRAIYVYGLARKIIGRLEQEGARDNVSIAESLNDELSNYLKHTGDSCIGAAAMRVHGKPEVAFKSRYFPWACCSKGVITSGCIHEEVFTKHIEDLDMPYDCECD